MTDTAVINEEMLDALLVIHRVASRALSAEERIGQRIQRDHRENLRHGHLGKAAARASGSRTRHGACSAGIDASANQLCTPLQAGDRRLCTSNGA